MSTLWASEPTRLQEYLEIVENATTDQVEKAQTMYGNESLPGILSTEGDTATIEIFGILRKKPATPLLRFFGLGGTSYQEIIEAVAAIQGNEAIKKVLLAFDTPGGTIDGLDEAYQAIADLAKSKEVIAEARGLLASAGYYLAAPANRIMSSAPTNLIGSIGVVVAHTSWKQFDEKLGVKEIIITSKNAPNKWPDPETPEGKNTIQDQLDSLERIFHQRIAQGRHVSVQQIAERFGQGGVFVSQDPDPDKPDAIKAGMIDGVILVNSKPNETYGDFQMTLEQQKRAASFVYDKSYPEIIRELAAKVVAGVVEPAALDIVIANHDAQKAEEQNREKASWDGCSCQSEQEFQQLVSGDLQRLGRGSGDAYGTSNRSEDGSINSEADFQASVRQARRQQGLPTD